MCVSTCAYCFLIIMMNLHSVCSHFYQIQFNPNQFKYNPFDSVFTIRCLSWVKPWSTFCRLLNRRLELGNCFRCGSFFVSGKMQEVCFRCLLFNRSVLRFAVSTIWTLYTIIFFPNCGILEYLFGWWLWSFLKWRSDTDSYLTYKYPSFLLITQRHEAHTWRNCFCIIL